MALPADRKNPLGLNSFWLLLARLTAQGLSVLFVALAARRLGVTIFGQFTVIASLVILGNTFTTFGTETFLIRETAKAGRVTRLASRALGLQLALSVIWWLATFFIDLNPPLLFYTFSLFPLALFSVTSALLRAFERMDLYWILALANGLVQCAAVFFSSDLKMLCLSLLLGQTFIALLACWICSASLPRFVLIPSIDFFPLLGLVLPFAAMTTLSVFTQRLGIFSVSVLMGDPAAGVFSSAARTVEALKFGHYAVLGALLPALSRDAPGAGKGLRHGFQIILALSVLMAGGIMIFAKTLIMILFGEGYVSAIPLLSLLGWTLVPYTFSAFISVDMVSRGMESTLVKIMLAALAVFAILYAWLIQSFGMIGGAWAALLGESIQAGVLILVSRRTFGVFGEKNTPGDSNAVL